MDLRLFYACLYREAQTMGRRVLYCSKCNEPIVVDGDVPAVCPNVKCQSSTWRSAKTPAKAYRLSYNDKKFLKQIRIAQDETD